MSDESFRSNDMVDRKRIGEILVKLGALSLAEVDRVLDAQERRGGFAKFGQVATDMGLADDEHILAALAVQMELFQGAGAMSMTRLLERLRKQIMTPGPMPVKQLRRRLAVKAT